MATSVSGTIGRVEEYREWSKLAQIQTQKPRITQLKEILALKKCGGQCGISDYYWYKLYDDTYQLGRGARDYLGWRLQVQFSLALNPRNAVLPAWDKSVFTVLASAAGLPVAPIRACYHPAKRISRELGIHLADMDAVADYLRNPAIYPMFGKPAYSQQGYGSAFFAGYDTASDRLNLLNGKTLSVEEFMKRMNDSVDRRYHRSECGFLFQECFAPAHEIKALTGWSAICGVRIICLNGPDGAKPIRALWKVAVPPNHVDNFSLGKYGNLLADIDLETGEISRVINGFWPKTCVLSTLPSSGQSIVGFRLPGWERVLEACRRGGAVFPLMQIHHWDFALTEQGPMILELNDLGATEFAQVHGRGLLTEETREFLRRYGNATAFSWIKKL